MRAVAENPKFAKKVGCPSIRWKGIYDEEDDEWRRSCLKDGQG
jgi:hypothetical protein